MYEFISKFIYSLLSNWFYNKTSHSSWYQNILSFVWGSTATHASHHSICIVHDVRLTNSLHMRGHVETEFHISEKINPVLPIKIWYEPQLSWLALIDKFVIFYVVDHMHVRKCFGHTYNLLKTFFATNVIGSILQFHDIKLNTYVHTVYIFSVVFLNILQSLQITSHLTGQR